MLLYSKSLRIIAAVAVLAAMGAQPASAQNQDKKAPPQGLRVLSAGHSFHVFMPNILRDLAKKAGIDDHVQVDLQSIGGSRVIQHWNLPDEKNRAKKALASGKVDVLTLSPIYLPDEGIQNFARLALKHNPNVRVTVQEFWLPFDMYEPTFKKRPKEVDHDALSVGELRKRHVPYFASVDAHVRELNEKLGKQVVFVVPVGQAVLALRERILDGKAAGLTKQSDLFTDAIGHARPPLQALAAYCHYATLYRRSPIGLPAPAVLSKNKDWAEKLNPLLQELAWQAVREHPLSGVRIEGK